MKKFLTVSELETQPLNAPIWALNGSAESEVGQAGDVHVGIPKLQGSKVDPLYLPQTFLPQCLTDQIPRPQLLASSEFRNAINNRLIKLITPEFANAVLSEDGVDSERQRLDDLKRNVREATAARSITQPGAEIFNTAELSNRSADDEQPKATELSSAFTMFATSLTLKSDQDAVNLIRGRGKISRREVNHLLKTLTDKPKTRAMLKAKLQPKAG